MKLRESHKPKRSATRCVGRVIVTCYANRHRQNVAIENKTKLVNRCSGK